MKKLSTKSATLQQQAQKAYKGKDNEVKKSARNDKRSYVEGLAAEAESSAARGEMSTVYKITKRLCGNYSTHSAPVKGKMTALLQLNVNKLINGLKFSVKA